MGMSFFNPMRPIRDIKKKTGIGPDLPRPEKGMKTDAQLAAQHQSSPWQGDGYGAGGYTGGGYDLPPAALAGTAGYDDWSGASFGSDTGTGGIEIPASLVNKNSFLRLRANDPYPVTDPYGPSGIDAPTVDYGMGGDDGYASSPTYPGSCPHGSQGASSDPRMGMMMAMMQMLMGVLMNALGVQGGGYGGFGAMGGGGYGATSTWGASPYDMGSSMGLSGGLSGSLYGSSFGQTSPYGTFSGF